MQTYDMLKFSIFHFVSFVVFCWFVGPLVPWCLGDKGRHLLMHLRAPLLVDLRIRPLLALVAVGSSGRKTLSTIVSVSVSPQ